MVRGLALLALLARLLLGPNVSFASGPAALDGGGGQQGRELRAEHGAGLSGVLHHVRMGSAGEVVAISAGLPAGAGAATAATAATVGAGCGQAAALWAKFLRNWMLYCSIPVVAGLLNWATNNLAVKMIFYPLNFWGLKLKTWPDTPLGLVGLLALPAPLCVRASRSQREREGGREGGREREPRPEQAAESACGSAAGREGERCGALAHSSQWHGRRGAGTRRGVAWCSAAQD